MIVTGAGGNFCLGGDVHEIIGPLVAMDMPELLDFTRMTGDLVKAIPFAAHHRRSRWHLRRGRGDHLDGRRPARCHPRCQGRLSVQPGGPGRVRHGGLRDPAPDHGQSRAAELLYFGRNMTGVEGERWGYFSRLIDAGELMALMD